ncbi:DUF4418 family protein [Clostridium sp. CS001]|uniref:DUF4418 family protein n=1 Tax=Clostridium sp. CS001 TaxID=2880648 RepID=UPI001CF1CB24|nr:DUF4418 family protein [Clostridium sp. CS001]MCB2289925.1 DUF4418 family protein [Clostridium sp. CS001]
MRKKVVYGIYLIIIGAVLAVGPHTLFAVCEKGESIMKCWWSAQAEISNGILIISAGIAILVLKSKETQLGISIMTSLLGVSTILIPSVLIGGCMKSTMPCQSVTFPWIYIIGVITIIVSLFNCISLLKQIKRT